MSRKTMPTNTIYMTVLVSALSLITGLYINTAAVMPVNDVLTQYQQQGAKDPDPAQGETLWTQTFRNNKENQKRSCSNCHTINLRNDGKHIRTNKTIDPLAPSVNKERLTDAKKIEKWFKRNCKWTLGRECNAQEKMDFLSYIRTQ